MKFVRLSNNVHIEKERIDADAVCAYYLSRTENRGCRVAEFAPTPVKFGVH